jgi:hypothetical protein
MKTYVVHAARHDDWWALSIDVPRRSIWTQCRRLEQAEAVAREAVAMATSVPPNGFKLDLRVELDKDVESIVESTLAASLKAAQAQAVASEQSRRTVRDLRERGFTVRDVARLLGLSPARVSQLLAG